MDRSFAHPVILSPIFSSAAVIIIKKDIYRKSILKKPDYLSCIVLSRVS